MYTKFFRYFLTITTISIIAISIWITNILVDSLKKEECKKIVSWAESIKLISSSQTLSETACGDILNSYNEYLLKIIKTNTTIPAIVTDDNNNVITSCNILPSVITNKKDIEKKLTDFKKKHFPIIITLDEKSSQYVYYDDSTVLKQLQLFPSIQLTVIFIFVVISFWTFSNARRAEQNKIWMGLSKETAHQLGTPISSLMAWIEYLKSQHISSDLISEMNKDVQRLEIIAERFSKIGSHPTTESVNLQQAILNTTKYIEKRISQKVSIVTSIPEEPIYLQINESLLSWVIENLIKNAIDAMNNKGILTIHISLKGNKILLDISDTGRGIPKSKFSTIFHPGYTTKQRGWGLGLSLAKRIIESYQKGKIYVYKSELGRGTTFRIELKQMINNHLV